MRVRLVLAIVFFCAFAGAAQAAKEIGVVTLAGAGTRVLRGATWYKLAPGLVLEDADIVAADAKALAQLETRGGVVASVTGPATALLNIGKDGVLTLSVREGWLKLMAKPPGAMLRSSLLDADVDEGIVVVRVGSEATELFVEAGAARVAEPGGEARDVKDDAFVRRPAGGGLAVGSGVSRSFVGSMPRHYMDRLPVLAARIKSKPALVVDHEVTFEEAQPWLEGRDRGAFERRFAVRLRDPAFRKAVAPHVARYPMWDRILHPEKYQPKPKV